MATTMSMLFQSPQMKVKIEPDSDDNIENSSQNILIMRKKMKDNQVTSMPEFHVTEQKQVLGQISMNHQKEPAAKKRRISDGMSSKIKPAPAVAVARRNARERNRVKQVNNGFSMLRDHIPKEIADNYEQAGRGSAKKLSKVETLRMAVEYIRSLEQMLSFDTSNDSDQSSTPYSHLNNTTFSNMSSISETSLPATPPPENQQPFFYALKPHSGVMETQITIIGGQQYLRIPGTNTFQLVTHDIFENAENIHPNAEFTTIQIHPPSSPATTMNNSNSNNSNNIMASTMNFVNEINSSTSVINTTTETPAGSISPYSGHSSLSPAPSHHGTDNIGNNNIIMEDGHLSCLTNASVGSLNNDQKLPYADHLMIHCAAETSHYENIILKEEIMDDDGIFDESSLSNENMIDAMQWWEQQQSLNQNGSP